MRKMPTWNSGKGFEASNGIVISCNKAVLGETYISIWKPNRARPSCYLTKDMATALFEYLKEQKNT